MPIMAVSASGSHRPPAARTRSLRARIHSGSESTRIPSISKTTHGLATGPPYAARRNEDGVGTSGRKDAEQRSGALSLSLEPIPAKDIARVVLDVAFVGLAVLDELYRYVYVNPRGCDILGASADEL